MDLKHITVIYFLALMLLTEAITAERKIVLVDKNCIDGQYILTPKEQYLKKTEIPSISDLVSAYSEDNFMEFVYGVLERRYPTGKAIIEQAGGEPSLSFWLSRRETASQVLGRLGTAIHEVGHGIDVSSPENVYYFTQTPEGTVYIITVPGMHGKGSTSSSPMFSMARSLLLADDQNYKRPPAESDEIKTSKEFGEGPFGCDGGYAETYLNGDPTDDDFDGGDQGFNSLVEEYSQYINSLAFAYYFRDYNLDRASSHRHALLGWLWWMERFLRKIRVEHEDQYAYVSENKEWREFILTLWGRAWLYLRTDYPGMQPDSDQLTALVQQEEVLAEIQYIRDKCDCNNPEELLTDVTGVISDLSENKSTTMHCYPRYNAVDNSLTLHFNQTLKGAVSLELRSVKGQKIAHIHSGTMSDNRNRIKVSLNTNKLSRNMYIIRISSNEATYYSKVLIN